MIVLDTNVISEMLRPKPAPQVAEWLAAQAVSALLQLLSSRQKFTTA